MSPINEGEIQVIKEDENRGKREGEKERKKSYPVLAPEEEK